MDDNRVDLTDKARQVMLMLLLIVGKDRMEILVCWLMISRSAWFAGEVDQMFLWWYFADEIEGQKGRGKILNLPIYYLLKIE